MTVKIKWEKVISAKPFYRDINLGNGTLFRICAFKANHLEHKKDGVFIAIERKSSCWIFQNKVNPQYVSEKLLVNAEADMNIIADWINAQLGISDAPQFGEYNPNYIVDNEPYGLIGEYHETPLCPEIIENE